MSSVGRRDFDRHIAEEQLADLRQRLLDQGVPEERVDAEGDLFGLAAEVNIRGIERVTPAEAAADVDR